MKPLQRGNETGIVEIPGNWYVKVFRTSRGQLPNDDISKVLRRSATYDVCNRDFLHICMGINLTNMDLLGSSNLVQILMAG